MITFGDVARRAGGWLPLIGLAGLVGSLSTLALPTVLGNAVDALITGHSSTFWVVAAGLLIAANVIFDVIDAYAGTACVAGTTAWLRDRVVRHVLAIGPARSARFETGDLVTRVSGSATEAAQAGPALVTTVSAALPPIGSLVLLAWIDLWLALALLAGLALVVVVLRTFALRSAEVMLAYLRTQGTIAARLAESLGGARTIAAAGTVGAEERRVLAELPELHEHGIGTWKVMARSSAQATLVGPLVLVAVLAAGGLELLRGRITPGELFAASQYAVIGGGLGALTGVFSRLARAKAGVHRVGEVLGTEPLPYGAEPLPDGPGTLEFRGVTVRADDAVLLENVTLRVPGGAAVAVVGASGAGKSVLAEVAARLRTPDEGEVLLDGVALAALDHHALRAAVGCAFERPVLVGASIGDAVAAGREVDVRASARATHANEFVNRLPDGYATPLTEAPMSGGEYQRLGLARAWPARRLLVLDDATSSVDMVTEMQIARTLTEDHGGRTRLIVTHRAATAARADLVVWLDKGKVAATGTHEQLWARPGYREVFG
ncbi:ATP-binding cassette subfamily B protein [Amycolatopsis sulphurea]|uniref:ATP-binding cassette subfamily B protein n=1 Tax=Amycolatopsis sulphurea TaxID=76022 RepID=A0A2A9G2P3_9PSEU|nr:ABC transporter ATP-binding protein [Amycolatopsis sulphurea]PFG57171.1 ATP-binding cassette subfamily B protein [Amycolatopsis sulphurea]